MESPFLPGFDTAPNYTGEGKGGPNPSEEDVVFQTTLPLILISPRHIPTTTCLPVDIHITLTLTI